MFRKFDGGEVAMGVVVHMDDIILAHAKDEATTERFAAELEKLFNLKDMGDGNCYKGLPTLSKANGPQTPKEEGYMLKFPY